MYAIVLKDECTKLGWWGQSGGGEPKQQWTYNMDRSQSNYAISKKSGDGKRWEGSYCSNATISWRKCNLVYTVRKQISVWEEPAGGQQSPKISIRLLGPTFVLLNILISQVFAYVKTGSCRFMLIPQYCCLKIINKDSLKSSIPHFWKLVLRRLQRRSDSLQ